VRKREREKYLKSKNTSTQKNSKISDFISTEKQVFITEKKTVTDSYNEIYGIIQKEIVNRYKIY
jgi:hypothetical protein